uniref:Organic cation/carnitine transporter 7-like n=1 Tax=Tanacetum cinerariifolium TaxID=118510 RepID=A0A6L2M7F3_TANCI|nr:organic cation/carnitine transporter 7-like [Tanacetum cinerariifolium]
MDLERLCYTVDEGISAIGIGRFQYMILAYAGVEALGKAMELMPMTYMDLERLSYTVDEGISAIGMGRFQYMILAYVGVGALGKAMELMPIKYVGLESQHDLELPNTYHNIIFVFTYIAMVVGALTWGFVMDRWGRK